MKGQVIPVSRIYASTLDKRENEEALPKLQDIKVKYYANKDVPRAKGLRDEPYERGLLVEGQP